MSERTNPYLPSGRETVKLGNTTIVRNKGRLNRRILIGIPTLGLIRIEFHVHRHGQSVPLNWTSGEITANHMPPSVIGEGYHVADAQNVIAERAILDNYEWLFLIEDDVLMPFDTFMRMSVHMERMTAPVISGLYYSKGEPTWPLVFRGRGNGAFRDWALGDQVWCDGVPTGHLLLHGDLLRWFWRNSEQYKLPDGRLIKRVFETPRRSWYDPESDRYFAAMGTSDLNFCDRIIKEKVFEKVYPKGHPFRKFGRMKYPFLVDTHQFSQQVDHQGKLYPAGCREILANLRGVKHEAATPNGHKK